MTEFLHHYAEIMTDPAHMAAEITFMIVIDLIFLGLCVPLAKRYLEGRLRREHQRLDAAHGIVHDTDTPPASAAPLVNRDAVVIHMPLRPRVIEFHDLADEIGLTDAEIHAFIGDTLGESEGEGR